MIPEIQLTRDGNPTLYSERFNEAYHSRHGSLTESMHVFIRQGLHEKLSAGKNHIRIGEIGLGSYLNAALAFQFAKENAIRVEYLALEAFPPPLETLRTFSSQLPPAIQLFHSSLLACREGENTHFAGCFSLQWTRETWPATGFLKSLDVLFYDAFSPDKQPELWTTAAFETAFESMNTEGILVTYCSKSYVRRNMLEAGFLVEKLPGPPGKREMLRARKPVSG